MPCRARCGSGTPWSHRSLSRLLKLSPDDRLLVSRPGGQCGSLKRSCPTVCLLCVTQRLHPVSYHDRGAVVNMRDVVYCAQNRISVLLFSVSVYYIIQSVNNKTALARVTA